MKLKIKHFDAKVFEKKMEHLKDINFTLFMDDIPTKPEDSSEINIFFPEAILYIPTALFLYKILIAIQISFVLIKSL